MTNIPAASPPLPRNSRPRSNLHRNNPTTLLESGGAVKRYASSGGFEIIYLHDVAIHNATSIVEDRDGLLQMLFRRGPVDWICGAKNIQKR